MKHTTGDILMIGHSTSGEIAMLAYEDKELGPRLKGRFLGWGTGGPARLELLRTVKGKNISVRGGSTDDALRSSRAAAAAGGGALQRGALAGEADIGIMDSLRIASVAALLCLVPYVAMAQEPPVPTPGAPDPPPTGTGACTIHGPVLGPTDFGVAAGAVLADTSGVRLADGRVRLYTFAQGRGIVSAVSITTEGLSFAPETGARLPDGSGMPRVVGLPDGRVRLFYTSGDGIKSAISTDGLTFTLEPGFRITAEAAGFSGTNVRATSGATVTTLADGRFRMYFSDLPRPGDPPGNHLVKSAVSTDMLAWTVEAGVSPRRSTG